MIFSVLVSAILFTGSVAYSAENQTQPPQMTPEMQAMMAKWKEASTPAEGHKVLEPLIGTWDATTKWWKDANGQPEESKGTSNAEWILGGRFIQQKYSGTSMGQPFDGIGVTGYDNLAKKYQTSWIDNMGTGMMTGSGTYDAASKSITDAGSFSCPMTGGERTYRSVLKFIDDKSYSYEMYMNDPKTGQEFRGMEIIYTKKS